MPAARSQGEECPRSAGQNGGRLHSATVNVTADDAKQYEPKVFPCGADNWDPTQLPKQPEQ